MKLIEEFIVAGDIEDVWRFFEQPEAVAACMPGVEHVRVVDENHVRVIATQSIGPMTATFEADILVLERVPNDLIRFRTTGRSVRGAVGNLRAENEVRLSSSSDGTTVSVEGDIVLAGALGSVGQKAVARQARKVTAEFAGNLQRALTGAPMSVVGREATATARNAEILSTDATRRDLGVTGSWEAPFPPSSVRWAKAALVLGALSLAISVIALSRQGRTAR